MRIEHDDDDAGAQRLALCEALPDALGEVTGDEWFRVSDRWRTPSGVPGRPCDFWGVTLRRASDGLEVSVMQSQPWAQRMEARPSWPYGPRHGVRRMADAGPDFRGDATPHAGFDPSRPAAAVAKQIARKVLTPRVAEALAAMRERDRAAAEAETTAETWRQKVGEAAGLRPRVSDNGAGPRVWWHDGTPHPFRLESSPREPGGTLTLELPEDPDGAARVVSTLRAVLEAERIG